MVACWISVATSLTQMWSSLQPITVVVVWPACGLALLPSIPHLFLCMSQVDEVLKSNRRVAIKRGEAPRKSDTHFCPLHALSPSTVAPE